VLAAVENFYTDVVQTSSHGTRPPKVSEGEPPLSDEPVPGEAVGQQPDDMHPITDSAMSAGISGTELPWEDASSR
jgi:hypothetical protein